MSLYVDYRFKSYDGLTLYARDYQHEAPIATIVCIHGLTRNCVDFSLLCEHLAPQYRLIAVDLRGRGESDYDPNPHNYHPGIYAEDIITLLDSLQLTSVVLVGTSLGGLISMILNALRPKTIAAVIMNDIGPEASQAGLERIKSYVCNPSNVISWEDAISKTRKALGNGYPDFDESDWATFTRNLYRENRLGIPELNYDPAISVLLEQHQNNAVPPDLWPLFSAMQSTPLLLLRGELSDVLTRNCVAKMQAIHTNMQFTEITNCGHTPLLSEKESLQSIDRFLTSLQTPPLNH